ncbi:GntR family transcriptional regulator [Flindersiella endophytica]
MDPLTGRRLYLRETVPAGPTCSTDAEKVRTTLLAQVDERRNPRTRATVNQLIDRYLEVWDVEDETRRSDLGRINKHIRPLLGKLPLTKVEAETLEGFYALLAKCRDHCGGRKHLQHRTPRSHVCDEHKERPCRPLDPACRSYKRMCKAHVCVGLKNSSIRKIHSILSGAFVAAVRWKWISLNPADHARQPGLPHPNPDPPRAEEAALLVNETFKRDRGWGRFIWSKMRLGSRRGEMCALRRSRYERGTKVLVVRSAIYKDLDTGELKEKDTKTHQQRRVLLDDDTCAVIEEQIEFQEQRAQAAGVELVPDPFLWSPALDGSVPLTPDSVSQRFDRLASRLGIDATIKDLRTYNVTELIAAGADMRTVAGRVGHGSGGATTLRVYAAWRSEADQRAAANVSTRMPAWPGGRAGNATTESDTIDTQAALEPTGPYQQIARDLQGAIAAGILRPGDPLPTEKDLAAQYGVVRSTAHRAVAALVDLGLVVTSRGRRTTVKGSSSHV